MKKSDFLKLQKTWYDMLKQDGFKDIEYQTPQGDADTHLALKSDIRIKSANTFNAKYYFYYKLTNFLTHNPYYPGKASQMWQRWALEMYAEGYSYREITNYFKQNPHLCLVKSHLPTIHAMLKKHIKYALSWNKENEEGV